MNDAQGKLWTRAESGVMLKCEDGREMSIVPEMTDDYLLSVINTIYAPKGYDQAAAMKRLRDVRSLILNALSGIGFDSLAADNAALAAAVSTARQGLKDMPKLPALLAATSDQEFDAAAMARYTELVIAAPDAVRMAFRDLT